MLKRFKLYKSGKLWIRGLVLMTAVGFGTIIGFVNTTFADDSNNVGLNQDEIAQQSSTSISGVSTTKVKAEDDSNFNTSSNSLNAQATEKLTPDSVQSNQQNINKNGWQKNSEGQIIYYQNDKPLSGRQYSYLPTIPNTNVQGTNNWYLTDNGVVQAGFQAWAGSHYYFDPSTYLRVDNDYRTIGDGSTGYLLGSNGQALSGVQKWAGTYYYFDPTTYLKQNDVYATSQWGMKYMFGKDGRIVTGEKEWYGHYYYFDPITYLKVTNKWVNGKYYKSDGTRAQNETISINGQNYSFDNNGNVVSNRASQVVAIARQQLDKPYVWGATGPNSFDCSGLVQYVYRQIGVNLPRTTYQQEYQGTAVSLNALQPGDLLFWGSYGSAYHVAIYIGNGDFIQAPQPGERVKITNMSYYHPDFARRIL